MYIYVVDMNAEKFKNRKIIEDVHTYLVDVFVYLLEQTRPYDPLAIARIMQYFVESRNYLHQSKEVMSKILEEYSDLLIPPLTLKALDEDYGDILQKAKARKTQINQINDSHLSQPLSDDIDRSGSEIFRANMWT